MTIRTLQKSDDRQAVSRVYEESWNYAYKGIIPDDYLKGIPKGHWCDSLETVGRKSLIMLSGEEIIGTASFSSARIPEMAGWGELISIYLLPEYMGRGFGKPLLERAVSELKKMGFERVFLWVLEDNRRARDFYEKNGFTPTDIYLSDNIGGKPLREVQYRFF